MEPVVVSEDFKIEIPAHLRDRIKPGAKYQVLDTGDGIRMLPVVDIRSLLGKYPGVNDPLERDDDRV